MTELLTSQSETGLCTLILNRPAKLNALNFAMIERLLAALDAIEVDDEVRVVILTGAGDRAFSAGADIPEFARSVDRGPDTACQAFVSRGQRLTDRIEAFRKPIIVAVNGIAYGGGCEIVEAAALAVASDSAMFAKPEICLGMPPAFGGTQRLPRLAGRKRALQHLLSGDPFDADRAAQIGLVNQVVPHDRLMDAARAFARRIMRHSPLAVASILTAVARGLNMSIAEGLAMEREQFARTVQGTDLREGLAAWMERREPRWCGPQPG